MKEKIDSSNFYKYGFISLFVLIIAILVVFLINMYGTSKFNEGASAGQLVSVSTIFNSVGNQGFVDVNAGNTTLRLVPVQTVDIARQQTVFEIVQNVQQSGYVVLTIGEDQQIVLAQIDPSVLQQTPQTLEN